MERLCQGGLAGRLHGGWQGRPLGRNQHRGPVPIPRQRTRRVHRGRDQDRLRMERLCQGVLAGRFTGGGKAELLAASSAEDLYLYHGNGLGGFTGGSTRIGSGWNVFAKVFSPGDFTGDGKADLLAETSTGDLYLYHGNGLGGFAGGSTKIGSGWNIFL